MYYVSNDSVVRLSMYKRNVIFLLSLYIVAILCYHNSNCCNSSMWSHVIAYSVTGIEQAVTIYSAKVSIEPLTMSLV